LGLGGGNVWLLEDSPLDVERTRNALEPTPIRVFDDGAALLEVLAKSAETNSELKRERARVIESEAKYRRLSDSGIIGVVETDLGAGARVLDGAGRRDDGGRVVRPRSLAGKLTAQAKRRCQVHRNARVD
jgi:hypothetical protein